MLSSKTIRVAIEALNNEMARINYNPTDEPFMEADRKRYAAEKGIEKYNILYKASGELYAEYNRVVAYESADKAPEGENVIK